MPVCNLNKTDKADVCSRNKTDKADESGSYAISQTVREGPEKARKPAPLLTIEPGPEGLRRAHS